MYIYIYIYVYIYIYIHIYICMKGQKKIVEIGNYKKYLISVSAYALSD